MLRKKFVACVPIVFLFLGSCNQNGSKSQSQDSSSVSKEQPTVGADSSKSLIGGPIPNTIMTEYYVQQMAAQIYLWAWPMMNIHNRKVVFEKLSEPIYMNNVLPIAPPNHNCMLTDYIEPQERDVACPNQDVVYGFGLLDLSKEAVVIQVPDFGDRFWVYQICDQRTDGFASIGKMYGSKPGFYLLAGKDWNGEVPKGIISTFRSTTKYGCAIPRVFQSDDAQDKQSIQPLLQQIMMYPLSQFDGKMKATDWTKTKKLPPQQKASKEETKWVVPDVFFDELAAVIDEVPPLPGEEALYGQAKSLLNAIAKDPKLKEAAKQGAIEADKKLIAPLFMFTNVGYPVKYNWTTQTNGAAFGTDYLTRTACAKANIFVNKVSETKYFYQDLDSAGGRLNGKNKYTIIFAKGNLPPVKGFWSLTLYDQYHFFSPNAIKRFSLGTKNKNLKYNDDGSLTLYVQSNQPEDSKINNWLPAPNENFSLYIRCYWPDETILKDSWTPPPVLKAK